MLNALHLLQTLASVLLLAPGSTTTAQPEPVDPQPTEDRRFFFDLETPGGPLPFEVRGLVGWRQFTGFAIVNGDEEVSIRRTNHTVNDRRFEVVSEFGGFDSKLTLKGVTFEPNETWFGAWSIRKRSGVTHVPFKVDERNRRFELPDTPPSIASGRYRVTFASSPDDPAVGLFTINDDGTATGTFLTTTGDYRYLAGNAAGDTLKLSTFDGAHAFLFHAERQDDGSLKGDFWSGNWYHDTWTAKPDPDFRLPDPFEQTTYRGDATSLERLSFTDLDGTPTPVGALAPHGSPRIVEVFGSWCPNCHDATRLLTELHAQYKDRGLVVLGLAFEHSENETKAIEAVRTYKDDLKVDYPLLIAGLSDKKRASEMLPVLDRVRSFPTTLFIDADGDIRAVHSGFSGPATGDAHTELREQFTANIEAMLEEHESQAANQADMPVAVPSD